MKLNDPTLFKQSNFLSGLWTEENSQSYTEVINPSTLELIGTTPDVDLAVLQKAIGDAHTGFQRWKRETAETRAGVLKRWHQLMLENIEDLATILTTEQGKPFEESKNEIHYAASYVEWFAEEARRANGQIIPSHKPNTQILASKEPVGVVAAITPWNFPAAMITRKCAPAFAAGCSVILKPAPDTPFTAFALAELANRAGLPKDVLHVVTGDAVEIGHLLTTSPTIKKLSFTGSTRVGKILMAKSASTVKKVSLELGGNAPFIVFNDADIDAAVEGALIAKFRNAGQTCVCANRIFVHGSIHDEFVAKLAKRVAALKIGDGFGADVQIGPLINNSAVDKVRSHVEDALAKGARLECGKVPVSGEQFVTPVVLTGMTDDMLVAVEETFGPIAPIFSFDSDEEVIARANATEFGLASYIYTQSLARAHKISSEIEAGIVGINEGLISTAVAPFGGVKESGLGREGAQMGLDEYLETKYVLVGGLG